MKMEEKIDNKLIFSKYKILKILGKGSFGLVYKGNNIINEEKVAIKVEDWRYQGDILESEAYFLYNLRDGFGIPEVKSFGIYGRYKVLVQTLLGNSIEKEFQLRKHKFELKDICMIAIQLIDRLEYVHSKYIIHRDIKPDNILFDEKTKKIIYLIDFGLAKKYRSTRTGRHIQFTIPRRLTGTARYASVNALRGTEQSRRDDLESAAYVLIYLAKEGYLPWQGLNIPDRLERYKQIYQIKKYTKPEKLCEDISFEFCEFLKYIRNLQFEEKPDYDYLRGLFLNILNKNHFENNLIFSRNNMFGENKKNAHLRNGSTSRRKRSPYSKILRNIQNSKEREKNLEKINKSNLSLEIENKIEKRDNNLLAKRKKEKSKLQMNSNDEETKDVTKSNNSNIANNENHIGKHSDNLGTQITQINLSVNMDDIDINLNNNKNNELLLKKNKIIKLEKNDEIKNCRNNTQFNRPIVFDIKNGSFNNAQILKCYSQKNISTDFINIEKICKLNNNRISINAPILTQNYVENKLISKKNRTKSNNINKNSKNKNIPINNETMNSYNIKKIKIINSINIENEDKKINNNNFINNNQNYINNQKIIKFKLNETNPNDFISINNKSKSLDNNFIKKNASFTRKHYISPIRNLKNKNDKINIKHYNLKKIFFENKNNMNIIKDTKENNKNKIKYFKLSNENVINGLKNKVSNRKNPLRDKFNIQNRLNISNNEIKSPNNNSLKKMKSLQIKTSNYFNLHSSKSQDYSGNKKYNLKNRLYDIENLDNNKNMVNFIKYNNNNIRNPINLNKNKKITLFKKSSMLTENQLFKNRIKTNLFESPFSNKKRIYVSPMNSGKNNKSIQGYIYNNNTFTNSNIIPTNNNFNLNIINNNTINGKINNRLKYQNNNSFTSENLNNNINITISGGKNEYRRIFNFNKKFLVK